jgi:hypothetical protein
MVSSAGWSPVQVWIVVMKPCVMPTASFSTLATGAKPLRLDEAFRDSLV